MCTRCLSQGRWLAAAALVFIVGQAGAAPAGTASAANAGAVPRIFLHDPQVLVRNKARWHGERKADPALARLFEEADQALQEKPFSVVDKGVLPPSGDKHDYLSLAPYAWPDPRNKPSGLPYVIRDGQINPERDNIPDHRSLARICSLAETLGLAYFFSDDERYAAQAAALLHTFFVAPATRMNPNLNYAQGVRGKETGRAAGIIDAAGMVHLVDGVGLLASSKAWTNAHRDGLEAWFRDYLRWLRDSDLGRRESRAGNNHGTWYDVQVVSLALATGQTELASETLSFARKRRIGRQVDSEGQQPEELRRTRPWHYAVFNLQAMVMLANLGERVGVDLWRYQTPDGSSLRKAIAWLVPFVLGKTPWTLREIGGMKADELWPVVREAAFVLKDADFAAAAAKLQVPREHRLWLFLD
jgi:hypothetical protein